MSPGHEAGRVDASTRPGHSDVPGKRRGRGPWGALLSGFVGVCLAGLGAVAGGVDPGPVLDWNALFLQVVRSEDLAPTLCSRNAAVLHLSMFEAVNAIQPTHQPYRFQVQPPAPVDAAAAAAGAGHEALLSLHPSFSGAADQLLQDWLARAPATVAVTNGIAFGREMARRVLVLRADDGASTQVAYIPSDVPGQWRRTPPFYRPPLDPQWRLLRPFAMEAVEPYVAPPPPALDSPEYAAAFDEVRLLGAKDSPLRTPDESRSALFWSDFAYTVTPPGHWLQVAATLVRRQGTDLAGAARLMALMAVAQADSAIACWEAKYRYNAWRPVTAIRRADEDGNPATVADPSWSPFLTTPNFPEYTSGHSTFSQASAAVLREFYGTDALHFTATSDGLPGVERTYDSLQQCVDEIARSRVLGGIHFEFASREGKRVGGRVAERVLGNWLLERARLPLVRLEGASVGGVRLRVHGEPGQSLRLEASTDLGRWERVTDVITGPGGVAFTDVPGATLQRFYRVRPGSPR